MADSNSKVSPLRFLCIFFSLILVLDSQNFFVVADDSDIRLDLCNADLSTFLPVPFNNLSGLSCSPVWNTFVLRFFQSEDHVVTMILSAVYTTGWVGMGFSKNGMMVGSSCMVGWIGREGRAKIRQFYVRGFTPSEVIANKGELQLTNVPPAVVIHGATIYLAFQLKFSSRLAKQPILFAFSTSNPGHSMLTEHDDKTTLVFDFSQGSHSSSAVPHTTPNIAQFKKNHGVLGIIGWGVLLPTGAIIARYYKHRDPLWYYLHTIIEFVGFIIGLANVVAGKVLYDRLNAHVPSHRFIGFFVLVLSILQIMAFFLRPDKETKIRRYWNWYHHWIGRLALFFGALNVVLGIQVGGAGNAWKISYGFVLAFILVTVIVLEALLQLRGPEKTTPPAFQMDPIQ